jgi:hypothetical protein
MSELIFILIFGFIMLGLGAFALITGKLLSRRGITRREEKPVLYWIGTIFYLVIGVGFLSWGAVSFINF